MEDIQVWMPAWMFTIIDNITTTSLSNGLEMDSCTIKTRVEQGYVISPALFFICITAIADWVSHWDNCPWVSHWDVPCGTVIYYKASILLSKLWRWIFERDKSKEQWPSINQDLLLSPRAILLSNMWVLDHSSQSSKDSSKTYLFTRRQL